MPKLVRPINLKKPVVNRKLIAWGFVLTGLFSLTSWGWGRWHSTPDLSEVGVAQEKDSWWRPVKITYTVAPKSPAPIGQATIGQLQEILADSSGQYGVYIYRLGDKLGYGIAADKKFPAASIMKVPMMVAAYRQIESGQLTIDNVKPLLEAMGKRSDNTAPATLINTIGREFMRQTVADLGMASTSFDQNITTAYDVAQMWKNLYEGKLISLDHRRQLWEFLTDSIFEERIPAGVPEDVEVIHKVGTDTNVWADSGIVMADRPFVVVILNDEVNLEEAKATVPELVQTIYQAESAGQ